MSEMDILKLIALSGSVFLAVITIFVAGGLMAVIVAATLADAVLRQIEARRAVPVRRDDPKKM